jgi:hypothetical protein
MCFFRMIGHFREIDPGMTFRQKYKLLMSKYFALWESPGQNAKLKGSATRLRMERGPTASWGR